ncbi:MAG: amidohydrolase [Desulfobacteraceae bacterium]|nr:amidohydrolase [Desulfobacteraceae bacterium]MBU4053314.1 amidohydrolase family protein [Pseudomonadota bacterium]
MIIDMECDIPTKEVYEEELRSFEAMDNEGMGNYVHIFGEKWAADAGMSLEEFEAAKKELSPLALRKRITATAMKSAMTEADFIHMLEDAKVTRACIGTGRHASMEHTAELAKKYPQKFIPWCRINPRAGVAGLRQLEHAVCELGMKGLEVSTFRDELYANDKQYYPLYAKAVELNLPVRIYCTMNYATDKAMDLGRPIYIDEVARSFPQLTIIAGLGGWPWVPELVGLARRHPNLYIDFAAHRPKYLAKPGSGFEMLLQFGNTLLQDRILFASSWITLGLPLKQVAEEVMDLPIKESVKKKWMGENAARIFKIPEYLT